MRRKILSILLCLVCAFGFTGCSLFEHNYEKDYQQVIVRIAPITETYNGKEITTKEHLIYKSELVSLANSNLSNLVNSGYTVEDAIDYLVEQLVLQKLIINEADILIEAGEIQWGLTQDNNVQKSIYSAIDSQLKTLKNTIRKEQGEEVPDDSSSDSSTTDTSTTYPVPETEEADDVEDTEAWTPDTGRLPGIYGSDADISLDNEAMRRLIELFRENIEADFRISAADQKTFDAELDEFVRKGREGKYAEVYLSLGHSEVVHWLIGESAENNEKITLLQEYLTDSITVSAEDVRTTFESALRNQVTEFDADISAYNTAVTEGSDPVLYYASDKYLYVKHILIPFSDEQTAELEKINNNPAYTKEEKVAYREQLANGIVAYAHKDGEDDKSRTYTVQEIFNEVTGVMAGYAATPREAERKFDEFIYKYNTDPGIFDKAEGYAVAYELDEGESETYMVEFAEAARDFRDSGYSVGEVYNKMVITDYGVHIMYYAGETVKGEKKSLYDWQTVGEKKTYYDIYEEKQLTALQNARFSEWQQNRIAYYQNLTGENKVIFDYTDRYKDLKES